MPLYTVIDKNREQRFEGELLAKSSSRFKDPRWVEFYLYKTVGNHYVIWRIGQSYLYHKPGCAVIKRNNLEVGEITDEYVPCDKCRSLPNSDVVYPERPRYWTLTSTSAQSIVEQLHKYDADDNRYLTNVARRLLEDAAENDPALNSAYYEEVIP